MHTMHWLLPLALGYAPSSSDGAVQRAKQLLAGFGVQGRLHVRTVSLTKGRLSSSWEVAIRDRGGRTWYALLRTDGSVAMLGRGIRVHTPPPGPPIGKEATRYAPLVRRWLANALGKAPARLTVLRVGKEGVGQAHFAILRNGYPYLRPTTEICFLFDARTSAFLGVEALQEAVPVAPGRGCLTRDQAVQAAKRVWGALARKNLALPAPVKTVTTQAGEPQIGYALLDGASTAALVWRVPCRSVHTVPMPGGGETMAKSGYGYTLIDAITGKEVVTSTYF